MKIIFCIILLINGLFVYSQTVDVYRFPIKQGSQEWKQIESVEKRIATLQIPDTVLIKISTEGLLETSLAFPYLTDVLYADNYQKGFEALISEFNGFRELLKRRDLIDVSLRKYKSLSTDIKNIRSLDSIEQGKLTFRHFVLELLLTQDIVFSNLNPEQEQQLFLLSSEHKTLKNSHSDIFSSLNSLPTNLLFAKKAITDVRFEFKNVEERKAVTDFISAPLFIDQQIVEDIEKQINSSINIKKKEL
jgi:hypothetical protein